MVEKKDLADIIAETSKGADPFALVKDEEKETPAESPTEEKTKEEKSPSSQGEPEGETEGEKEGELKDKTEGEPEKEPEEKPKDKAEKKKQIPFHEHPRWKERERQWKENIADLKKANKEEIDRVLSSINKAKEPKTIPNWFKGLYGDDQNMWNEYRAGRKAEREELKQEILSEQKEKNDKQKAEVQKWNEWVDVEVSKLKADGKTFKKNELLKVALDFKPTDDKGNISLEKAYELMQKFKTKDTKKATARKKLADSTVSGTKGTESSKGFKTPKDFEGNRW